MALNFSTHAKRRFITSGFNGVFSGGWFGVYSGNQPDYEAGGADLAPTGTLLARIKPAGGISLIPYNAISMKDPAQEWLLEGIATGTAGWFRLHAPGVDTGSVSTLHARLDGQCYPLSAPGAGLILPDAVLSITPATLRSIDQFQFTF